MPFSCLPGVEGGDPSRRAGRRTRMNEKRVVALQGTYLYYVPVRFEITCAVAASTAVREVGRLLERMGWACRRRDLGGQGAEFMVESPPAKSGLTLRVTPGEDRAFSRALRVSRTRLQVEMPGGDEALRDELEGRLRRMFMRGGG